MNTTEKLVQIKILDQTGHTTLEQTIHDAIKTSISLKFTNGKNLNVRSDSGIVPFELQATSIDDSEALKADIIRFAKVLEQYEKPVIFVTGALAGGTI